MFHEPVMQIRKLYQVELKIKDIYLMQRQKSSL